MSLESTDRYFTMKFETASPPQLLLLTYTGALQAMRKAARLFAKGNSTAAQAELLMAMAAVNELDTTIVDDRAPELAEQLHGLYAYVQRLLGETLLDNKSGSLEQAINIISSLHDTWQQALQQAGVLVGAAEKV